MAHTHID